MDDTLQQYAQWGVLGLNSLALVWAVQRLWSDYKAAAAERVEDLKEVLKALSEQTAAYDAIARVTEERNRAFEALCAQVEQMRVLSESRWAAAERRLELIADSVIRARGGRE